MALMLHLQDGLSSAQVFNRYSTAGWIAIFCLFGFFSYKLGAILLRPRLSTLRHLPGPKDDQFIFGQGLRILRADGPTDLYVKWAQQWPDEPFIRCTSWFNSEILLVNSLDACRQVLLTSAYSFVKPDFFRILVSEFVGEGLLFGLGDQHKRLRRIIAGPLSRTSVREFLPTYVQESRKLVQDLSSSIKENDNEGVVEIDDAFKRSTLIIIGLTLFGKNLHTFRSSSSPLTFQQCYDAILSQPRAGQLISFLNPFTPLRWLPVPANYRFLRATSALKTMLVELIEERTADLESAGTAKFGATVTNNLLDNLIVANIAENQKLTKKELIDLILQFATAGHETTADALTWTTYALAKHTHAQDRLREELSNVPTGDVDATTYENLPYLDNVVRESLRVYPPAPAAPWETAKDVTIAGLHIPKGVTVQTVPSMIHTNPRIWGENALAFDPDRWDHLDHHSSNPFAMETFIHGPRMCPGKMLAILEIKVTLAELFSNFRFELVDEAPGFKNPTHSLSPKNGLRVKISRV